MGGVRHYVQELINHAIVADQDSEFDVTWNVFNLQFPVLEETYKHNAELLERYLDPNWEVMDPRILWLLTEKESTLIANAIDRIDYYLLNLLNKNQLVTMDELAVDDALLKAGLAVESAYGSKAGENDNTIGRWIPIAAGTEADWSIGTYFRGYEGEPILSAPGTLRKFGGDVFIYTEDQLFQEGGKHLVSSSELFSSRVLYYVQTESGYKPLVPGDYVPGRAITLPDIYVLVAGQHQPCRDEFFQEDRAYFRRISTDPEAYEPLYPGDYVDGDSVGAYGKPVYKSDKTYFAHVTYEYDDSEFAKYAQSYYVPVYNDDGTLKEFRFVLVETAYPPLPELRKFARLIPYNKAYEGQYYDYVVGNWIRDYGQPVYELEYLDSSSLGFIKKSFFDVYADGVNDNPDAVEAGLIGNSISGSRYSAVIHPKYGSTETFYKQVPVDIQFTYRELEVIQDPSVTGTIYSYKGAIVTNIEELNEQGIALFVYDPSYDWEKDIMEHGTILKNLHIRKLTKGWFGHGKTGWSKDINAIPYVQTIDEGGWTKKYKNHLRRYIKFANRYSIKQILKKVNGDREKSYMLFTIGNLYAVRHELMSIYFRVINEIRMKGLYKI